MTKFIIYGRVSTLQQGDNTSIPLQEDLCRQFGERQGWGLVGTFTDTESGAVQERVGLEGVFAALESGKADVVVVSRVDRIARDQRVFADTFERVYRAGKKVAIASEGRVYDDLIDIYVATVFPRAIAEHERLMIRERTESALRQRIREGGWIGAVCYGYELMKRPEGPKYPVPHNEQAQLVRYVFEQVIAGASTRAVALDLTAKGVRTARHGVAWHNSHVRNILARGRQYAGEPFTRTWTVGKQEHELKLAYPPLISPSEADEAARLVATRTRKPENESPFRGLVTCSKCGDTGGATSARGPKGTPERVHSYSCRSERRARYHRSMGLPHQEDFCRHTVNHRLIAAELLRYIGELDAETGASRFELEVQRVLELLVERRHDIERLGGELASLEQEKGHLDGQVLKAVRGEMPQVLRVLEASLGAHEASTAMTRDALEIARQDVQLLERALDTLGIDHTVELAQSEQPGTVVFDLGGLERRWRSFQGQAKRLEDALRNDDFTSARRVMWLLGLHVRIDFSRPALKGKAGTIRVEMDLARLQRNRQDEAVPYTPYPIPAAKAGHRAA